MANVHVDLLKMIGLRGVVCSKCDKLINPRDGHWYHTAGKDHPDFHGYHIPQPIMPMHYENMTKWAELLAKMSGKMFFDEAKFYNEVLGESADMGVKLVTLTDIKKASQLGRNEFNKVVDRIRAECRFVTMGVDWGGGGEDEISYTALAICGLDMQTGQIKCYYCERLHSGFTADKEARYLIDLFRDAGCHLFAHDFGGSGGVREILMIQAGMPVDRVMGFRYVMHAHRDLVYYNMPVRGEMRGWWGVDKPRSLHLQAVALKGANILLPEYESSKAVTSDLLNLYEEKTERPRGPDMLLIKRIAGKSDDFAHALNYASCAIWHATKTWPDLSAVHNIKLSAEELRLADPPGFHPRMIDQ
jgi:hypothetical protein